MTMDQTTTRKGSCPPLPPEKRSKPYEPAGGEPGYEGNAPQFASTKDFVDANGKREKIDGPTNLNHNRLRMLRAREILDDIQLEAGERLAKDWEVAQIMPVASSVLVGNGGTGGSVQL